MKKRKKSFKEWFASLSDSRREEWRLCRRLKWTASGGGKERRTKLRREKQIERAGCVPHVTCPLCGKEEMLVFDHCHDCGEFRNWLCKHCNRTIGFLENNQGLVQKMLDYIEAHKTKHLT